VKAWCAASLLAFLGGCASTPKPASGTPVEASLPGWPTGQAHSFAEDRGHLLVIDAWATWCLPCQAELPQLSGWAKQWASQGVRVYAVSIDTDLSKLEPFLRNAGVELPILLDPAGAALQRVLGLENMPTTWLFDEEGHVLLVEQGTANRIAEQVKALLARKHNP
jgi:thiol-disulfide isomerase/thioredoxin